MRIGALLLVAIGFMSAAACSANTSNDEVCLSGGNQCLALTASGGVPSNCGEQVASLPCDDGFVCCSGTTPVSGGGTDAGTTSPPATTDAATGG
jgi:hypothetical protein